MKKTSIYAAYLPQYHVTEDNNKFWGEGYTDWVGVKAAKPQFQGHNQPRVPLNNNYYDLLNIDTIRWQVKLTNEYGIDGFNIYHYWFKDGKQELHRPAELLLENSDINISYFFTWDNAAWKRTWGNIEGNDWSPIVDNSQKTGTGILVPFEYGDEEQWVRHFNYLLPFFKDPRYLKINNKPVFMLIGHSDEDILTQMGNCWKRLAKENGFAGLFLATKKQNFFSRPLFDSVFNYEPEYSAWGKRRSIDKRLKSRFGFESRRDEPVRYIYQYDQVWKNIIRNAKKNYRDEIIGSFVRYDDTPRRGKDALIVLGESPAKFKKYFGQLYKFCCNNSVDFMLITAWNEWGEGAYLEPDQASRYDYLEAIRAVVNANK